jgi:hypothetical protein
MNSARASALQSRCEQHSDPQPAHRVMEVADFYIQFTRHTMNSNPLWLPVGDNSGPIFWIAC